MLASCNFYKSFCPILQFEDCTFDWLYWPQVQKPFSSYTINYIKFLNFERDVALLKFYGWDIPVECTCTLHISTMLLKKGAEQDLTPFATRSIMCRETMNKESLIDEIVRETEKKFRFGTRCYTA